MFCNSCNVIKFQQRLHWSFFKNHEILFDFSIFWTHKWVINAVNYLLIASISLSLIRNCPSFFQKAHVNFFDFSTFLLFNGLLTSLIASQLFDGSTFYINTQLFWHARWSCSIVNFPEFISLDFIYITLTSLHMNLNVITLPTKPFTGLFRILTFDFIMT